MPSIAQRAFGVISSAIVAPSLHCSEQVMNSACGVEARGAARRGTYASSR
jgi:hypothetical protein